MAKSTIDFVFYANHEEIIEESDQVVRWVKKRVMINLDMKQYDEYMVRDIEGRKQYIKSLINNQ